MVSNQSSILLVCSRIASRGLGSLVASTLPGPPNGFWFPRLYPAVPRICAIVVFRNPLYRFLRIVIVTWACGCRIQAEEEEVREQVGSRSFDSIEGSRGGWYGYGENDRKKKKHKTADDRGFCSSNREKKGFTSEAGAERAKRVKCCCCCLMLWTTVKERGRKVKLFQYRPR